VGWQAAFLGSLFMKTELHAHERKILSRYAGLAASPLGRSRGEGTCTGADLLAIATPSVEPGTRLHQFGIKILDYEYLSASEAEELFDILFLSDTPIAFKVCCIRKFGI
jgi:hypothetical protein